METRVENRKRIKHKYITGKILHLDGDKKYSQKSAYYYRRLGLNAIVKYIPEREQPKVVYKLLVEYMPDILVVTGHDAMLRKGTNFNDIHNYKNSRHFIETVKQARKFDIIYNRKTVIFAGACQSYFEGLMYAGANYASSPSRILIDYLDPLIIAGEVATTEQHKYISMEEISKKLRDGQKGVGGIGSNGKMIIM